MYVLFFCPESYWVKIIACPNNDEIEVKPPTAKLSNPLVLISPVATDGEGLCYGRERPVAAMDNMAPHQEPLCFQKMMSGCESWWNQTGRYNFHSTST
jgi:hypothetical protein